MPNRFQRNSIGELVCHVPLNRGSLLKSIENLVKTIETSENAVMIPTLLRDKVRVDAWELLFVAKILKASILGHDDLVEFYMNHIHQNSLSAPAGGPASAAATPPAVHTPGSQAAASQPTPNGAGEPLLSPSLARHQSSPSMASPLLLSHGTAGLNTPQANGASDHQPASSTHSSQSAGSAASTGTVLSNNHQTGPASGGKSSSASWLTASQQLSDASASLASGSPFNSCAGSSAGSTASSSASASTPVVAAPLHGQPLATHPETGEPAPAPAQIAPHLNAPLKLAPEEGLLAARPLMSRLAQPPSLLQLTTTNNHINSVSELLNSPLDPSLDTLGQHLISLQQQQQLSQQLADSPTGLSLSILTSNGAGHANGLDSLGQQAAPNSLNQQHQPPVAQVAARHELRSSRSAGCLFRANSGASSPRTPGTPFPQAETLAGGAGPGGPAGQNGLVGDPTSIVKLLLQVEQLKASIVHVNTLLESVVELYKKSIDNISQ